MRQAHVTAALILCAACRSDDVQGPHTESWAADLNVGGYQMVLFMTFALEGADVSGGGLLSVANEPGSGDALTVVGVRRADTLELTYTRSEKASFQFAGLYTTRGTLAGTLDGAEFTRKPVVFRNR